MVTVALIILTAINHFGIRRFDRKSINVSVTSLSDAICAFANADGGILPIQVEKLADNHKNLPIQAPKLADSPENLPITDYQSVCQSRKYER